MVKLVFSMSLAFLHFSSQDRLYAVLTPTGLFILRLHTDCACIRLNAHTLPVQVLCAKHFISPALQMDADANRLFELHSL